MEIYPTKAGGREWFINMENPTIDGIFNPQSNISRQPDGSWRIGGKLTAGKFYDEERMNVNTPSGAENWKNVEITGYARINSIVVSYNGSTNDDLTWYARGGKHNPHIPCEDCRTWVVSTPMAMLDGRRKFGLQAGILTRELIRKLRIPSLDGGLAGRWLSTI